MNRPATRTNRSIQTRVMVLVGSGVLTSILVPGWVAWEALDEVTHQALVTREAAAAVAAHHVESVISREWNKLQDIAAAPGPVAGDTAETPVPADSLRSAYFRAELMERTFVTDATGRVTIQEPTSTLGVGGEIPGARAVMASGRPGVSTISADQPGAWFHLLVPIRDWRGRVVGVAGGSVNPRGSRIGAVLGVHGTASGSSIEMIDAQGVVVAAVPAATTGSVSDHQGFFARHIRAGTTASGSCHSCHGVQHREDSVMAFVPIRAVSWGVALKTPEAVVLARTGRLRTILLWLGPVLMGFGLLFAYGAAQSVLRPVRVLTRASERIADGQLDLPIPGLGRDELGRLGRSLEGMRAALKASIATIEDTNATLEGRVEDRTRDLKALSRQLAEREEARARLLRQVITAQEDERKRLARELHDETCQTISAVAMRLGSLTQREAAPSPELLEARALAVRALDELHRLIYDLRPSVLDDLGLWSAIRWYAERQLLPRGVSVRCEFADVDRRLPPLFETALFRVAQEAISNIAKHADAEQVLVQGSMRGDVLTIEIEDDGKGFEPDAARTPGPDGHGWGLLGITERIDALGGHVAIDSALGQGVRLVITVTLGPV